MRLHDLIFKVSFSTKAVMKHKNNLVREDWRVYFFVFFVCSIILQNSDVSAVTHKKSPSKSSLPSSSTIRGTVHKSTTMRATTAEKGIPGRILSEIRSLDNQLLCFPKLLCTIYQDDSITKRNIPLNATDLGVAYIKLLKAVHYMSPTASTKTTRLAGKVLPTFSGSQQLFRPTKVKQPIIQIFQIPSGIIQSSTYTGRKEHFHADDLEDYPHHLRSPLVEVDQDDDDGSDEYNLELENPLGDDDEEDREFLREKIEISQMMKDLKHEDEAEYPKDEPSSGGIASTILNSFLPFRDSRSIKDAYYAPSTRRKALQRKHRMRNVQPVIKNGSEKETSQPDVPQDAFWKAVSLWRKLKSRSQCREIYSTCPFEAWEVVRMLDLVKGQSKVLSAYLKLTVDNVKPARIRN